MKNLTLSNGTSIAYQLIEGDKEKPVLVFLHEGLGCIAMWKQFPQQLCKALGYPGLVYDRQGYGQSSTLSKQRTINYHQDYAFQELPEILSTLIPDQEFFIIGHSDGGTIGLLYASEKPDLLQGLITEAAHVFVEPSTITGIEIATEAFKNGKLDILFRYHGELTATVFNSWSDTWLSEEFLHWNMENILASIKCPVLVMQGIDDQYGSNKQVDAISQQISGQTEIAMIDNCGHIPHHEQTEITLERMVLFIKKHS